jgi:hypothetical protein
MKRPVCVLTLVLVCGTASVASPVVGHAEETLQRTVRGTVVATNVAVEPQTIVVEVSLPHQEVLVVGARVPTEARITRGKQAARLADIKVGEKADFTYLKTSDGLVTRSVHVR